MKDASSWTALTPVPPAAPIERHLENANHPSVGCLVTTLGEPLLHGDFRLMLKGAAGGVATRRISLWLF